MISDCARAIIHKKSKNQIQITEYQVRSISVLTLRIRFQPLRIIHEFPKPEKCRDGFRPDPNVNEQMIPKEDISQSSYLLWGNSRICHFRRNFDRFSFLYPISRLILKRKRHTHTGLI